MSRADAAIRAAAGTTVFALAAIAAAISYSHMRLLADQHGETGWRAHAFPLSVDGIEIVASLVLLADRRAGRRSGWLPWTALAAGTAASVAANVAVGGVDGIGRIVAGWPAFALLLSIKLMSGLLESRQPVRDSPASGTGRPGRGDDEPHDGVPVDSGAIEFGEGADRSPQLLGTVPDDAEEIAALLPAARRARNALIQEGRSVTRDALAQRLRADGHQVRNARVSLLRALLEGAES